MPLLCKNHPRAETEIRLGRVILRPGSEGSQLAQGRSGFEGSGLEGTEKVSWIRSEGQG